MKATVKNSKMLILSFTFLFLFQCCATYYKNSFPQALEKASAKNKAVVITSTKGEKLKYVRIIVHGDSIDGIKNKDQLLKTIPIDITTIKELKLKSNTILKVLRVSGKVILISSILTVWVVSGFDFDFEN